MLRVRGLAFGYNGRPVLRDINLDLREGSVVLLQGANGSGKTTLLNILSGNLDPDQGEIVYTPAGTVHRFGFPSGWWRAANPLGGLRPERLARIGVGRTWQGIRLFETQDLADNVILASRGQLGENPFRAIFSRRRVKLEESARREEALALLGTLDLRDRERSYADQVSLGQAKRVAILRAVQAGASILMLDEPLSGLDQAGIAGTLGLLKRLSSSHGVTLVVVEHETNVSKMLDVADSVWILEGGLLTVASPEAVGIDRPVQSLARRLELAFDGARTAERRPLGRGAFLSTLRTGNGAEKQVLQVERVSARRGARLVLGSPGVSLSVGQGDVVILEAPNGWGKTTLLEGIVGLLPISGGRIYLGSKRLDNHPAWRRRGLGVRLLRARNYGFGSLKLEESLSLSGIPELPRELSHLAGRRVSDLSGGERQRLAITEALGGEGLKFVFLDEPFQNLDAEGVVTLIKRLVSHASRGIGILLAVPSTG